MGSTATVEDFIVYLSALDPLFNSGLAELIFGNNGFLLAKLAHAEEL
ncbi:MAG: hypothetical protein WBB21_05520 [Saprospiraceae bacterium]